ncbi:MAG: hypothetical protein HKN43_14155 [Rhodothermales bacterium]|nr:hypothetical protein [Rhodothermales bacterium]
MAILSTFSVRASVSASPHLTSGERSKEASTQKVGLLQWKIVQHKTRIQILEEQIQLLRTHEFG